MHRQSVMISDSTTPERNTMMPVVDWGGLWVIATDSTRCEARSLDMRVSHWELWKKKMEELLFRGVRSVNGVRAPGRSGQLHEMPVGSHTAMVGRGGACDWGAVLSSESGIFAVF